MVEVYKVPQSVRHAFIILITLSTLVYLPLGRETIKTIFAYGK